VDQGVKRGPVFTIGHSTHPQDRFIELLRAHGISAVADVRSQPYSRFNPQFNRRALETYLQPAGVDYLFLGKELGARSDDPSCYLEGKVSYERLAGTDAFRRGIERVEDAIAKGLRTALMCAEREPLECHRTILVARRLAAIGYEVQHIHSDGRIESHAEVVDRLVRTLGLPGADLFRTRQDVIEEAYRRQGEKIAYST
jgi:uncharacterized protein (DUF488 family)